MRGASIAAWMSWPKTDRKSTRLNSSHSSNSYAVNCLKKKTSEQFGGDPGHTLLQRALPDDAFDVVMVCFNLLNPLARYWVFPQFFFFNDTATTEIYTLSLHDALPI